MRDYVLAVLLCTGVVFVANGVDDSGWNAAWQLAIGGLLLGFFVAAAQPSQQPGEAHDGGSSSAS